MIGDSGQMGVLTTGQAADHGHQGIEMLFAMPGRTRLIELHNALFYGTIAAIRVAHGVLLLTERSFAERSIS